jgi:hypothetical protein
MFISGLLKFLSLSSTIKSGFIVMKKNGGSINGLGNASAGFDQLGIIVNAGYRRSSVEKTFYKNLTKYVGVQAAVAVNEVFALSTVTDYNFTGSLQIGTTNTTQPGNDYILEWGWYNRVLTEMEIIYNQNALMKRYNIV